MPVVLGGDFNVIPQDIDCYDPAGWEGDALTRDESRAAFSRICHDGYVDAIRSLHPSEVMYSYWDYQAGAWQKDNGVRIDHLLLSPEAAALPARAWIAARAALKSRRTIRLSGWNCGLAYARCRFAGVKSVATAARGSGTNSDPPGCMPAPEQPTPRNTASC